MPQCSFKNCKNNYRNNNVSDGVSYFRFPCNPFSCAEWVSIVAKERGDCLYNPAKNSVICSDHFDKFDISGNTQRRRLVKTAVPKLQIQFSTQDIELATPIKLAVSDFRVQTEPSTNGLDTTQKGTCSLDQTELGWLQPPLSPQLDCETRRDFHVSHVDRTECSTLSYLHGSLVPRSEDRCLYRGRKFSISPEGQFACEHSIVM